MSVYEKCKPFIFGVFLGFVCATGILIGGIIIADIQNNQAVYNKTIVVTGKLCPISMDSGKIQDENNETYFIPLTSCSNFTIGESSHIEYNKIHQVLSFKEFDYKRLTGHYGGW